MYIDRERLEALLKTEREMLNDARQEPVTYNRVPVLAYSTGRIRLLKDLIGEIQQNNSSEPPETIRSVPHHQVQE